MGKNHRVVTEEGAVLIAFDEIAEVIRYHIGPIFSIVVVFGLPVDFEVGVGVAGILPLISGRTGVLPEAGLTKSEVLGGIDFLAQLPLPYDTGGISLLFKQMGKGGLLAVEYAKLYIVSGIGHPRHDFNAGWGAQGLRVAMGKACPSAGELIEMGRLVGCAPIGSDTLIAHVIRHNEDEVWLFLRSK